MHVHRVHVAGALPPVPDLHHELPGLRELQDHVIAAAGGRRLGPSTVSADPHEVLRIDPDSVLAFRPIEPCTIPSPTRQELAPGIELEYRRRGIGTLVSGDRARPMKNPDVIVRVDSYRRHLAKHPVVRNRRPCRIDLKRRRTHTAGLLRCGRHEECAHEDRECARYLEGSSSHARHCSGRWGWWGGWGW